MSRAPSEFLAAALLQKKRRRDPTGPPSPSSHEPWSPPPPPPGVCIRELPGRGRCLIADRAFARGETILSETPLLAVAVDMPGARAKCGVGGHLACDRCLTFLGPADLHCSVAAGTPLNAAAAWLLKSPTGVVSCGCGALYCSRACADADVARGHRLLCEGEGRKAAAALRAWRSHAEGTELPELELAARLLVARLCADARLQRGSTTGVGTSATRQGIEALATAETATALELVQEPVATVIGRDAAGAEAAAQTLGDVSASCSLLLAALLSQERAATEAGVTRAQIEAGCVMEGLHSFGALVGLTLLNQCAVTVPSPAAASFSPRRSVEPLDATGLFWFVCMMNHSCCPNAELSYAPTADGVVEVQQTSRPASARIVAACDIPAGGEIMHSYVDRHESRKLRREALAMYGFTCTCRACTKSGRRVSIRERRGRRGRGQQQLWSSCWWHRILTPISWL